MKKTFLFLISSLSTLALLNAAGPHRRALSSPSFHGRRNTSKKQLINTFPRLIGYLKAPDSIEHVPPFRILFAGKSVVNNKEGIFTIKLAEDAKDINSFYLLFVGRIRQNFEKINTIENLAVDPAKHNRFFRIFRTASEENPHSFSWHFEEENFSEKRFTSPENCVVVVLNPAYVDHLEEWQVSLPDNYLKLPKIVLKDNVSDDVTPEDEARGRYTLRRASAKSLMYTLDTLPWHEKTTTEKKEFSNAPHVDVSMMGF